MATITINGISFDPVAQAKAFSAASLGSLDASESNYILIQTRGPLSDAGGRNWRSSASSSTSTCPRTPTSAATSRPTSARSASFRS